MIGFSAADVGSAVVYRAPHIRADEPGEEGVITSVTDKWVFVRFATVGGSKATAPELLQLVALPSVEQIWCDYLRGKVLHLLRDPGEYCMSGSCGRTNWGGTDRLHYREADCPTYSQEETQRALLALAARVQP